jgi:hypothetical protein
MTIEKVKIGGIVYDVIPEERLQADDRTALIGQIDYEAAVIKIDPKLNSQMNIQTLWHEIIHGIFHQNGRGDQTEELIDSTAYSIVQVLRDNHALMDAVKELDEGIEAVK